MERIVVNALGKQCPIPVVETKKALGQIKNKGIVETHVDNMTAVENLKRLAESEKMECSYTQDGANYIVTIAGSEVDGEIEFQCECEVNVENKKNTVIVFDAATMGKGSDELGAILIKGFIFAVSQLEDLPKTCIFYNSGAKLTAEGSESLEDIKNMEKNGVEILTCGTCADFFKVKEKIAVGTITNMYTIVETMAKADKIIRP